MATFYARQQIRYFVTAGGEGIESVQVTRVGRTYPFSITQEQFSIEGRGLVREATLEGYRENSEFAKKIPGEEELPASAAEHLHASAADRTAAVGNEYRFERVHRVQRLCDSLPGGKQRPRGWQAPGVAWPNHALAPD